MKDLINKAYKKFINKHGMSLFKCDDEAIAKRSFEAGYNARPAIPSQPNEEEVAAVLAELRERLSTPPTTPALVEANSPAPAAVLTTPVVGSPSEAELLDMINEHFGHAYWANRCWSAWQVGTMKENDFSMVSESDIPAEFAAFLFAKLATALSTPPAVSAVVGEDGQPWVSVKERLPETDKGNHFSADVLLYFEGLAPSVGYYDYRDGYKCFQAYDDAYAGYVPAYWQAITLPTATPIAPSSHA